MGSIYQEVAPEGGRNFGKSSEEGLDQEFNSIDAQREAAEAFIASQKAEGWTTLPDRYDDGGYSGEARNVPPWTV